MAKSNQHKTQPRNDSKKTTKRNSRATVSGPAVQNTPTHGDVLAEKAAGTNELAAEFAFNSNKAAEYDADAALMPPDGARVIPDDPIVGASTVTELNDSEKVGTEPSVRSMSR